MTEEGNSGECGVNGKRKDLKGVRKGWEALTEEGKGDSMEGMETGETGKRICREKGNRGREWKKRVKESKESKWSEG